MPVRDSEKRTGIVGMARLLPSRVLMQARQEPRPPGIAKVDLARVGRRGELLSNPVVPLIQAVAAERRHLR